LLGLIIGFVKAHIKIIENRIEKIIDELDKLVEKAKEE
jgi:hypothetical protein